MNNKIKKYIFIFVTLVIISIVLGVYSFSSKPKNSSKKNQNNTTTSSKTTKINNDNDIYESTEDTIDKPEDDLDNSEDKEQYKSIIFIENINFLANQGIDYRSLMDLKTKLNNELRTIDPNVYQVDLDETSFEKTEKGFKIQAKADTIDYKIYIEQSEKVFSFKYEN